MHWDIARGAIFTALTCVVTDQCGYSQRKAPADLPAWFAELDRNRDGQISLREWEKGNKPLSEFIRLDRNDDGLITFDEALRQSREPIRPDSKGPTQVEDVLFESSEERYRGKKSFKIFVVKLQAGRTYQIDHISKLFQAFLYLEDPDGEIVAENSSPNIGGNSQLVFRADRPGTYRLIATSLGGFRTGPFSLTVSVIRRAGGIAVQGLPKWFTELDLNQDGQVSEKEWEKGGRDPDEFSSIDQNDDGFATAAEVLRHLRKPIEIGAAGREQFDEVLVKATEGRYLGKIAYKTFTLKLEAGKRYQIDLVSKEFQAFLFLEGPEGTVLDKHCSETVGALSRLEFRPQKTGTYRVIATSLGGFRTGPFSLSIGRSR